MTNFRVLEPVPLTAALETDPIPIGSKHNTRCLEQLSFPRYVTSSGPIIEILIGLLDLVCFKWVNTLFILNLNIQLIGSVLVKLLFVPVLLLDQHNLPSFAPPCCKIFCIV